MGRGVKGATLPGMHREKGIGIGTIVAARCSVEGVLKLMAELWHGSRQGIVCVTIQDLGGTLVEGGFGGEKLTEPLDVRVLIQFGFIDGRRFFGRGSGGNS